MGLLQLPDTATVAAPQLWVVLSPACRAPSAHAVIVPSIGAQLDNLRCNDNLETKLQGDLQKVEDATKKRIDNVDLVTQRLDKLSDQNSKSIVAMKTVRTRLTLGHAAFSPFCYLSVYPKE